MGNELFGVDIARIVADVIGPGVLDAVLAEPKRGTRVAGSLTAGRQALPSVAHDCKGFWEDFAGTPPPGVEILVDDRKAVIIGDTMPSGVNPQRGWSVTIEGVTQVIVRLLHRDPAAAVYTYQCRDRLGPSELEPVVDPPVIPDVLLSSDFVNNVHTFWGEPAAFRDLWVDAAVDAYWQTLVWLDIDPAVVTPGLGFGGSALTAGGFDYYLLASPAVLERIDINAGFTAVYEGFIDQNGSNYGAMSVVSEDAGISEHQRHASLSNHDPAPPYSRIYNQLPGAALKNTVNGYHRVAATMANGLLAFSLDGSPAEIVSNPLVETLLTHLYLHADMSKNPARTGVATTWMKSVALYPPKTLLELAALSAVAPSMYEGSWHAGGAGQTAKPVITGGTGVGSALTVSDGSWNGNPVAFSYQWKRNGVGVPGATADTYVLVEADQGTTVTCVVTASNEKGATPAEAAEGFAVPAGPISVSDFANGVYSINGVAKTFQDLWGENPDFNAFDPATLVPGVGLRVVSSAVKFNSASGKPELAAALGLPGGVTAVLEYSIGTTGTARPSVGLEVADLPAYSAGWFFGHRSVGVRLGDYAAVYDDVAGPAGAMKAAVNLNGGELAYSLNGAAPHVAPGDPQDNPVANFLALSCQVNPGGTGVATAIVSKISFYGPRPTNDLQQLSAP